MIEDEQDGMLERWFQSAFNLTDAEEDRFWEQFVARQEPEACAWAAFTAVMLQVGAQLRQATEWTDWPLQGIPAVA
jgi:hypothetical protein